MRKVKIKTRFDSIKNDFKISITMIDNEDKFYNLLNDSLSTLSSLPELKYLKTVEAERIVMANFALTKNGLPTLSRIEADWMIENFTDGIRQL